ncbi:MAG: DUF2157 domain-containing protein [Candidatus Protochlamydia sp.]|nr:DUF2157 domain-containing protein [Candidatus Protochlamydia sp.]
MKIFEDNFFAIASELKIPKEQAAALWNRLGRINKDSETNPFAKYLFYLGAMIVISAMTWFMNLGWEVFGGGGIFLIASVYALLFTGLGAILWKKKQLKVPSGLLITMAVCMVPLAIYGLQTHYNLWPNDNTGQYSDFYTTVAGKWIYMELGTILAGIIALFFFPFPFITVPIFLSMWFLTMDLVPFIFGREISPEHKYGLSMLFGIALIALGIGLDHKKKGDYGFWSYFFGTLSFWCGLGGLVWGKSEITLFIYLIINLMMMVFSIVLKRMVLMIFGCLGVFAYLAHLTYNLFKDSTAFPFILSLIGLGIIFLGIIYQKNSKRIEKKMLEKLPSSIRNLLPPNRL